MSTVGTVLPLVKSPTSYLGATASTVVARWDPCRGSPMRAVPTAVAWSAVRHVFVQRLRPVQVLARRRSAHRLEARLMARDTRLRVAIATPSYPPDLGGLGNHVHDLAAALADLGCAVSVMSQFSTRVKARPPLIERYSENLTVRRFPNRFGGHRFGYAPSLRRYVEHNDGDFDVLHAFGSHAPVALAMTGATDKPFFFSPVFHAAGYSRLADIAHVAYDPVAKRIFEKAEVVFCSSNAERDEILRLYPFCADWAKVVAITVDSSMYEGVEPFQTDRPVILSCGRLDSYKRVGSVIEAMTHVDGGAELVICGSGPDESRLRTLIDRAGVAGSVRMLGRVSDEDLHRWQRTATVVVSLSTHESFGLSLAEGAVAGATIVAFDIAVHRQMADAMGVSAAFVPTSATPETVAAALSDALDHPLTSVHRELPRGWGDVARDTMALYEHSLASPRQSA